MYKTNYLCGRNSINNLIRKEGVQTVTGKTCFKKTAVFLSKDRGELSKRPR